jgi:hypothetical protein
MADIIQQPINYEAQEQKLKQQQIYIEQEMHRERQEANKQAAGTGIIPEQQPTNVRLRRERQSRFWSMITDYYCYYRGMNTHR